ncbi:MAG: LCP family protein [Fimbriimonadaceae bacterium]
MTKRKKLLIAIPLLGLAVGGGCFAAWSSKVVNSITKGDDKASAIDVWNMLRDPRSQFPARNAITILLVGKDYNRDSKGIQYTTGSRADTIMLIAADLVGEKISAISIPRDTRVTMKGITSKINGTLSRGGTELLTEAVSELTGIKPDFTVVIKPDAVREIVNAVGGVEVETIDRMDYDDSWGKLHIHLPAGKQRINGDEAVGFSRFREVNTHRVDEGGRRIPIKIVHSKEEGDGRRMARQQMLIRAIVNEARGVGNLSRAGDIIDKSFSQIESNLSRLQLAALAQIFRGMGDDGLKTATLIGTESQGPGFYYFVPDIEKTESLVDWLFFGSETSGRKLVKIAVYNGTVTKGVAKNAANLLDEQMFDAFSAGNAKDPATVSELVYRTASVEERARHAAKVLGITSIRKATPEETKLEVLGSVEPDVRITIGTDLAPQLVAAKSTDRSPGN